MKKPDPSGEVDDVLISAAFCCAGVEDVATGLAGSAEACEVTGTDVASEFTMDGTVFMGSSMRLTPFSASTD